MKKHSLKWSNVYLALVFIILYAPIIYLMIYSFSAGKTMESYHGFSFQHYLDLFADTHCHQHSVGGLTGIPVSNHHRDTRGVGH